MGGEDDKHWRELEAQRRAHAPRANEDRAEAVEDAKLHPRNEGHDAERLRARLEAWAAEGGARNARALRRYEEAGGAGGAEETGASSGAAEPFGSAGPAVSAGAPRSEGRQARQGRFSEGASEHGKASAGGEPRKHPRPPEDTTPEPGRGATPSSMLPGEPPHVEVGPDGEPAYVHGREPHPRITRRS